MFRAWNGTQPVVVTAAAAAAAAPFDAALNCCSLLSTAGARYLERAKNRIYTYYVLLATPLVGRLLFLLLFFVGGSRQMLQHQRKIASNLLVVLYFYTELWWQYTAQIFQHRAFRLGYISFNENISANPTQNTHKRVDFLSIIFTMLFLLSSDWRTTNNLWAQVDHN